MNTYDELLNNLKNINAFKATIKEDLSLSTKTTFKIGGNAKLFIAPQNFYSFQILLDQLLSFHFPFFILGGGSNIVFPDNTFEPVVISTAEFNSVNYFKAENLPTSFGNVQLQPDQILISCFSGTPVASVVNFCTQNNISGFEQFAGLPGTIGGALYMNARCFEKSISDVLFSSAHIDYSEGRTKLKNVKFNANDWAYKKSPFQNSNKFITTATFLLTQKSKDAHEPIELDCKKYINERVSKGHFKFPSAGSVFKNNHDFGAPSGKLIDDAGLKGFQIGGAKIADFHGNFIVNVNNASAADVKQLVEHIQKIISQKYGFKLEPEIIFVEN